jgi:hypothetical protein
MGGWKLSQGSDEKMSVRPVAGTENSFSATRVNHALAASDSHLATAL